MKCTNCESELLRWHVGTRGPMDVPDGRIRMSEVNAIAYLACEECSETLRVIESDEIDDMLNRNMIIARCCCRRGVNYNSLGDET